MISRGLIPRELIHRRIEEIDATFSVLRIEKDALKLLLGALPSGTEFLDPTKKAGAILVALRREGFPMNIAEIAAAAGLPKQKVYNNIYGLVKRGMARRVRKGVYSA